jgi:hypothetical protein
VANTEDNRREYRELLLGTPGVGQYISGAILFEETLFQVRIRSLSLAACAVPAARAQLAPPAVPGGSPAAAAASACRAHAPALSSLCGLP